METLEYACKICGTVRHAEYDPACDNMRLAVWQEMLTCNRCYDYISRFLRLKERIWSTCFTIQTTRASRPATNSARQQVEQACRESLVELTKKMAGIVCDYFCIPEQWDADMVDLLMEKPGDSNRICDHYRNNVRKVARQSQEQQRQEYNETYQNFTEPELQ